MKFHMALPVVYSCFLAACVGDFQLELCTYDFCASDEQKEKKEIKIDFENLSGNVKLDLSAGAKTNETIVVDSKNSSGEALSFSGFLGDDEFVKVTITEEPDNQICKLKDSGGTFKGSDITEGYSLTVSCVDANILPVVGYSVLGDFTLTIDGKEDFVVSKDSTDIKVKTIDAYTYDSKFEITSQPDGSHCKVNTLSDFHKNAEPGRVPVELYCFAPSPVVDVVPAFYGWSALRADGLAVYWGYSYFSDTSGVRKEMLSIDKLQGVDPDYNVAYPNWLGAIKKDGGIVGWGFQHDPDFHGFNEIQAVGVTDLYAGPIGIQAYTNTGEFITKGKVDLGGPVNVGLGIKNVHQNQTAIAIHKTDDSLVILGDEANKAWNPAAFADLSNVKKVMPVKLTNGGFIILKESNGITSVVSLMEEATPDAAIQARLDEGVKDAVYCSSVVSAVTISGDLVVWGWGSQTTFEAVRELDGAIGPDSMGQWANMQKNVKEVTCNGAAFAATRMDGTAFAYGEYNGSSRTSSAQTSSDGADFYPVKNLLVNIKSVMPVGGNGFLAESHDKKFIYWGRTEFLDNDGDPYPIHGTNGPLVIGEMKYLEGAEKVVNFSGSGSAVAGLMPDGSVVASGVFGDMGDVKIVKFADVEADLHDVVDIYASAGSFAALRSDGVLVTWGAAEYGGDSSEFHSELNR